MPWRWFVKGSEKSFNNDRFENANSRCDDQTHDIFAEGCYSIAGFWQFFSDNCLKHNESKQIGCAETNSISCGVGRTDPKYRQLNKRQCRTLHWEYKIFSSKQRERKFRETYRKNQIY